MATCIVTDPLLEGAALVAWQPRYAPPDFVHAAGATIAAASGEASTVGDAAEGPLWFMKISAGRIRVGSWDPARAQRIAERSYQRAQGAIMQEVAWEIGRRALLADGGDDIGPCVPPSDGRRSIITEWSAASRARMVERLSTLDYGAVWGDRPPAMVTLTLPAAWWEHAPSGEAWKRLTKRFFERFRRAWGVRPVGLWKQEMQRRGAPHLHMLITLPTGRDLVSGLEWREWLGRAWADCLGVTGDERAKVIAVHRHRKASGDYSEGLRASDPRRVALYFLKHGQFAEKEYQNRAPELWQGGSVGRWWGYWGIAVVSAVAGISGAEAAAVVRAMRRWNRANNGAVKVKRRRPGSRRWVTYRSDRMTGRAGFLLVNDAVALALALVGVVEGVASGGAASGASASRGDPLGRAPADPSAYSSPRYA